jgi:hypothetical protein
MFSGWVFRGVTREKLAYVAGVLLISLIAVSVIVIIVASLRNGPPNAGQTTPTRSNYLTLRSSPTRPTPYYRNCREAHADGRWDIPTGDPAYRRALDGDGNGVACESPKSRR